MGRMLRFGGRLDCGCTCRYFELARVDLDQDSPCGEWTLAAEGRWLCAGHWPCMHPRPGALGMFQRCPTLGPRHLHARIDERTIEGRELR